MDLVLELVHAGAGVEVVDGSMIWPEYEEGIYEEVYESQERYACEYPVNYGPEQN